MEPLFFRSSVVVCKMADVSTLETAGSWNRAPPSSFFIRKPAYKKMRALYMLVGCLENQGLGLRLIRKEGRQAYEHSQKAGSVNSFKAQC